MAKKNVVYGFTINGIKEECTLNGVGCPRHRIHSNLQSDTHVKALSESLEKRPRIVIDSEWENADPKDLVSIGLCECGEVEMFTHRKDANFSKAANCSDSCKSIAEARQAWFDYYGYTEGDSK